MLSQHASCRTAAPPPPGEGRWNKKWPAAMAETTVMKKPTLKVMTASIRR